VGTNGEGGSDETDEASGIPIPELDEFDAETEDVADDEAGTGSPTKMEAWRKRSATGAILTGIALGFQQVFEPERNDPAIIQETSGEPPKDLPVEAEIEQLRPRQSVVSIRPWLLPDDKNGASRAEKPKNGDGAESDPDADQTP
jgi:hypothetical protein